MSEPSDIKQVQMGFSYLAKEPADEVAKITWSVLADLLNHVKDMGLDPRAGNCQIEKEAPHPEVEGLIVGSAVWTAHA